MRESHSDQRILARVPYEGAAATVHGGHAQGHFVQLLSRPATCCRLSTAAWLESIGLPFDDLQCPTERVAMCVREGIELLIDDSPLSIAGALGHGSVRGDDRAPLERGGLRGRGGDLRARVARARAAAGAVVGAPAGSEGEGGREQVIGAGAAK